MYYKSFVLSTLLVLFSFIFVGCDSEKEVDLDSPMAGKWVYAIPEDDWSLTYDFKKPNLLEVTEYEEGYVNTTDGEWELEGDRLTLKIYYSQKYPDIFEYTILSRTSKKMVVYNHEWDQEETWTKK